MGYESRVIIARKSSIFKEHAENIAELNLCKVDGEFLDLFSKEYKREFYDFYGSDDRVVKDRYGDPLRYATFNAVYKWLLDNVGKANYRRYDMLLGILTAIRTGWADDLNEFVIIHYGY